MLIVKYLYDFHELYQLIYFFHICLYSKSWYTGYFFLLRICQSNTSLENKNYKNNIFLNNSQYIQEIKKKKILFSITSFKQLMLQRK